MVLFRKGYSMYKVMCFDGVELLQTIHFGNEEFCAILAKGFIDGLAQRPHDEPLTLDSEIVVGDVKYAILVKVIFDSRGGK